MDEYTKLKRALCSPRDYQADSEKVYYPPVKLPQIKGDVVEIRDRVVDEVYRVFNSSEVLSLIVYMNGVLSYRDSDLGYKKQILFPRYSEVNNRLYEEG